MKRKNVSGEEAAKQARTAKLKAFLTAFRGAPISTTDHTPDLYRVYKYVRRLYPNKDMWRPSACKYPPRVVNVPVIKFCHRPQVHSRMLSSTLGRTLQWVALNPTLPINELAVAMKRSEPALRNDIQKLRNMGILYQTRLWAIHPLLIGDGRLFNDTAQPLPIPDDENGEGAQL